MKSLSRCFVLLMAVSMLTACDDWCDASDALFGSLAPITTGTGSTCLPPSSN